MSAYIDVLGFRCHVRRPEEAFAYLIREGVHLMLGQIGGSRSFGDAPMVPPFGRGVNLQIEVADVDALYADVQRSDLMVPIPIEERWYRHDERDVGQRQFVVADPDGYLLRFASSLGTRPHRLPA